MSYNAIDGTSWALPRSVGQVLKKTTTDKGHREDWKHQYGVAFIVRKEVVGSIISCTPISSRFAYIRISARPRSITAIQVYAPTSDQENDEVETLRPAS